MTGVQTCALPILSKVIKDGEVAVLYSPGYGAGWSTWNHEYTPEILFDPVLVDLAEQNEKLFWEKHGDENYYEDYFIVPEIEEKMVKHCAEKYPEAYLGGIGDLAVKWLPVGTEFRIHEYDGNESVEVQKEMHWYIA